MADTGIIDTGMSAMSTALGIRTPDQVVGDIEAQRTADQAEQYQQPEKYNSLARHVLDAYQANKDFRAEEWDRIMLEDFRQFNGEYDPDKLADIKKAGQPVIFMPKTGEKCRGGLSWIADVINFDNGKLFSLEPTPLPDLPPAVMENINEQVRTDLNAWLEQGNDLTPAMMIRYKEAFINEVEDDRQKWATTTAKRMEKLVYDQMEEGQWHPAFRDFLSNLVWAPCAYIKGPVLRRVTAHKWVEGPFGWYPRVEQVIKPTFEAPSPFDIYPSREAVSVDDGELCERLKISPADLEQMKGCPGWIDEAIDKVLASHRTGAYREFNNTDAERARIEGKGSDVATKRDFIEGVEYWGSVSGSMLKENGIDADSDGNPLADLKQYQANVTVYGNTVTHLALNPDLDGKRPYMKTFWHEKPGSWYGSGIPRLMRELQQLINATIRSLCFNMSQSSGYQTIINDINRVPPGEQVTTAFAGKVWQFTNHSRDQQPPMTLWQPDTRAMELLAVYEKFSPEADLITNVPRYAMGNDNNGNSSRTLGGLSILMSNAARGIKMVLSRIDKDVYQRAVEKLFNFNMKYSDDESVKGDVMIVCRGALSQIVNEQNSQKLLSMLQATANPIDAAVIGPEQRGFLWREYALAAGTPSEKTVKTEDEIKDDIARQMQQERMQMAGQGGNVNGEQTEQ